MYDDEEINFEDVIQEEKQKMLEQEKRDAEMARKLLEEDLQNQEDEMLRKALDDSL